DSGTELLGLFQEGGPQPGARAHPAPGRPLRRPSAAPAGRYPRPGPLAQRVEQGTFNPKVLGSRPRRPTARSPLALGRAGRIPAPTGGTLAACACPGGWLCFSSCWWGAATTTTP